MEVPEKLYKFRTSINDHQQAKNIARAIAECEVASSAHIRAVESIYRWQGKIVEENEWEIECLCAEIDPIKRIVNGMHPYELPEMIFEEIECTKEIAEWIASAGN